MSHIWRLSWLNTSRKTWQTVITAGEAPYLLWSDTEDWADKWSGTSYRLVQLPTLVTWGSIFMFLYWRIIISLIIQEHSHDTERPNIVCGEQRNWLSAPGIPELFIGWSLKWTNEGFAKFILYRLLWIIIFSNNFNRFSTLSFIRPLSTVDNRNEWWLFVEQWS